MRKEFKVKNKLLNKDDVFGKEYVCGILVGNEKFSFRCTVSNMLDISETTIEIKEAKTKEQYENIKLEINKKLLEEDQPLIGYYGAINIKEGWIASDIEDIGKIAERLDCGIYDIYFYDYGGNFILIKRPKRFVKE